MLIMGCVLTTFKISRPLSAVQVAGEGCSISSYCVGCSGGGQMLFLCLVSYASHATHC